MDRRIQAAMVFNKNAELYQNKFARSDLYNDGFDLFCSYIKKQNAAILDVACGPGNITKYLLQQRSDFKITGVDLAPKMLEIAAADNPFATFKLMDIRDIKSLESKYSGVICGFGLPYLSKKEAVQWIADAAEILEDEGILYISTMEDDENKSGWKTSSNGEDKVFMHYHEQDYLLKALADNGFNMLVIKQQPFPTQDQSPVTDLILIAQKHGRH